MWPVCLSVMSHPALTVPGCSVQSGARSASLPVFPGDISFDNGNKPPQAAPFGTITVLVKWFETLSSGLCPLSHHPRMQLSLRGTLPAIPYCTRDSSANSPDTERWQGMKSRGAKETYK